MSDFLWDLPEPEAVSDTWVPVDSCRPRCKRPGLVLKQLRETRDESLEVTSCETGIPLARLEAFETGTELPTVAELTCLAKHLDAIVEVLLDAFSLLD